MTLSGLGILLFIIGILFFSGLASYVYYLRVPVTWDRLFLGFNYRIVLAFSFFLMVIGFFPVFAVFDPPTKKGVKKIYFHLILLVSLGILILIYSFLVYTGSMAPLDPLHSWFDYLIISTFLIIFGFSPIVFSIQDKERVWDFKIIFMVLTLIGIFLILASSFIALEIIDLGFDWLLFGIIGGVILFIGILPLFVTSSYNYQNLLSKLKILWIIVALVGFILFFLSLMLYLGIIPSDSLGIDWQIVFLFGCFVFILGLALLGGNENSYGILKKIQIFWIFIFIIGIIVVITSLVLVLPNSPELAEGLSFLNLGLPWDSLYIYGMAITMVGLVFVCSVAYFETQESGDSLGGLPSGASIPDIDANAGEMVFYLELINRSNDAMIKHIKEAARKDKLRPRVYESLIKYYQDQHRTVKAQLEGYRKKSAIPASKDVESLFAAALSDTQEAPVAMQPTVAPSPPPSTPVTPPTPPPKAIPTPPPTIPSVSPSITPPPAPSPSVAPPAPDKSPLDLIADARSTSIAELRGEMLKELRRLREIFKEE